MFKKDVSRASVTKGPNIEAILKDPVNLNYFKKFCMEEMSMENLLFWLEVEEFKSIEAPTYKSSIAKKLFNKYIKPGAPQQLGNWAAPRRDAHGPLGPRGALITRA